MLFSTEAKNRHFRYTRTWIFIAALSCPGCVTLGKLTSLNIEYRTNSGHSDGLLRSPNKIAYGKHLAQSLAHINTQEY